MIWFVVGCVVVEETGTPDVPAPDDIAADPSSHAPDPTCTAMGCLRSVTAYGAWTRAELDPWLPAGMVIDNGYDIYGITYVTQAGTSTATVTLPIDLAGAAPAAGVPVVMNAHGTVGLDDPCQLTGTLSGTGLAALFGAYGAIGVATDYPGLGTEGAHHYLDAADEGTSVLDGLRAAMHLARWKEVAVSGRAAVVGLSQGGHATLAAAALHSRYAPELDIRAFGASGPASMYEEQWRAGVAVPGEHQVMHAMMVWSFADRLGADRSGVWAAGLADRVDDHLTGRCLWSPDFVDEPLLTDEFPTEPTEVFSADFLGAYVAGDWSAYPFMATGFAANRIVPWLDVGTQTAPVAIWQGRADTTVLPVYTEALVADLQAGGVDVTLHLVDGGTHTTTAFGFLTSTEVARDESLAWVRDALEAG